MEVCQPPGYDQMSYKNKLQIWENLQGDLRAMNEYRTFEIAIFYSQLIAICSYIVFCKIFYSLKKYYKTFDIGDPFQKILQNKYGDFLEKENFFMATQVI